MEFKLIKSKKLPPVGIELGPLDFVLYSHAFLTKLTQVLIKGYLNSLLFVHQLTFELR